MLTADVPGNATGYFQPGHGGPCIVLALRRWRRDDQEIKVFIAEVLLAGRRAQRPPQCKCQIENYRNNLFTCLKWLLLRHVVLILVSYDLSLLPVSSWTRFVCQDFTRVVHIEEKSSLKFSVPVG